MCVCVCERMSLSKCITWIACFPVSTVYHYYFSNSLFFLSFKQSPNQFLNVPMFLVFSQLSIFLCFLHGQRRKHHIKTGPTTGSKKSFPFVTYRMKPFAFSRLSTLTSDIFHSIWIFVCHIFLYFHLFSLNHFNGAAN